MLLQAVLVPVEEFLYSVLDFDLVGPSEAVKLADIDELAHGAIGLGGVEEDFALEVNGLYHQLGEFADGELLACADIDVAVAYLAKAWDGSSTSGGVVAVYNAICLDTIVDG